jgi:lipoate-protein ligase A
LVTEEGLERDAVSKALMSVLRQDTKASLTALFKHIENSDENIREKILVFVRERVFPLKRELLHPEAEMERHITDLIKKVNSMCFKLTRFSSGALNLSKHLCL